MQANGFTVKTTDLPDLDDVKERHGVPTDVWSCHTAVVDGYAIEGHVPAADVRRLLKERPRVLGIAVPSMPLGSPGMEVPGRPAQPYRVLTFDKQGKTTVFATYGQ